MQARLTLQRFPAQVVTILVAWLAALTIGGALGYTLKPASVIPGATRTIVAPAQAATQNDSCVWAHPDRKAC